MDKPLYSHDVRSERGATLAEYAVLVALIAAIVIPSVMRISYSVRKTACYAVAGTGYQLASSDVDRVQFTPGGQCQIKGGMTWNTIF